MNTNKLVHTKPSDFQKQVRYVNGITILFYSKESIYAQKGINKIVCNRWLNTYKGSYKNSWSPFQSALKKSKHIESLSDIILLAKKYDVNVMGTSRSIPAIDDSTKIINERK